VAKVVNRTEDTDNALKKFFKALLQRFSEEQPAIWGDANINDILAKLA
jgi:hypothetical protein